MSAISIRSSSDNVNRTLPLRRMVAGIERFGVLRSGNPNRDTRISCVSGRVCPTQVCTVTSGQGGHGSTRAGPTDRHST